MKRLVAMALALVLALAAGCTGRSTTTPEPTRTDPTSPATSARLPTRSLDCTTNAPDGRCGPYDNYPHITGTTSSTYIGNNVWNPISGSRQTLSANGPGDWQVTAAMPAGNTAVVSYPSIAANYGEITDVPTPLTDFSEIRSSFTEDMHAGAGTSAWAAYDIWLGPVHCSPAGGNDCPSPEVMIQHDFAGNGACPTLAHATFGGAGGVPIHDWHLCKYGSQLIWKLGADERNKQSMRSGSVDILSMLVWLVNHHYLRAGTGLWLIGYGWEICSTGGATENFVVSGYSVRAALNPGARR